MTNDVNSAHDVTTPQDEASTAEAIRLYHAGRANTRGRWELLWRMWLEGKSFEEMGRWIGRHPTTAKQLLKRAFKYMIKTGMAWPTDKDGNKICDIPHPAEKSDYARGWVHKRSRPGRDGDYCPVCGSYWFKGKTLVEVFAAEGKKWYDHTRTGKSTHR